MKKILIISPKPFDETIGAGGTILKHIESGDEVHWLILSKPQESKWSLEKQALMEKEVQKASKKFNFKSIRRLNFDQSSLYETSNHEFIDVLRGNFEIIKPEVIYLPMGNEFLENYKASFEATFKALKLSRTNVKRILCYEIISSFDFRSESFKPNVYVDISDYIDRKAEIMNIYETEVEGYPMPRSVESVKSLAKLHGASISTEYAEAFMLLREIL